MIKKLVEFLEKDLKLRHNNRSKKMVVTIDKDDKTASTVDELARIIESYRDAFKSNVNWVEFKNKAMSELPEGADFYDSLQRTA
jgi:hypothetical protein